MATTRSSAGTTRSPWFDLDHIGRGAARFDLDRLLSLNAHYLQQTADDALAEMTRPRLEEMLGRVLGAEGTARLTRAMPGLKPRANSLVALAKSAAFYVVERPVAIDARARKLLGEDALALLEAMSATLASTASWEEAEIERAVRGFAQDRGVKLGAVAQPLRACLTGSTASPGIFEVAAVLGRTETLGRIGDVLGS